MDRRKLLGLLGIAPAVALFGKLMLKREVFQYDLEEWNPADPFHIIRRVEIVEFDRRIGSSDAMRVVACGHISSAEARRMNLAWCPDGVIRISDLCWNTMRPETKRAFLMLYNAREVSA